MNPAQATHPADQTLHAYGLGQLDDASAEAVNQHLEGCADCRRRVAEISSDSFLGRLRDARDRPEPPMPVVSSTTDRSGAAGERRSPAPSATGTLPPGLVDHPDYEVLRELGRGGMGVVYLAENKLMGRKEVLKVVSGQLVNRPGVLDRFLREIRSAAQLHHPHIVTAYSALRLGESLVLAMEYVEGFDLSRVVKAKGPLPVAVACNYVYQAALGLQHAHEHGMVHRDIKPSNLMFARQGNRGVVKILDFGLARVEREQGGAGTLTHAGQLLGTPAYMAPEQTTDPRRADIRADIYSLGCTFYYLLTGNPPFQGANLYDILQAHQSMEALPLNLARPEVPIQLAVVVATMMAKEPERRFGTPQEVAQALAPFLKKESAAAVRPSPVATAADSPSRPELSRADGWLAAPPAANVAAVPAPSPSKPAGPMPSGSGIETFIEVDAQEDLSTEVRAIREARASRAWLWPAAACVAVLLGLAVFVGMKIGAGGNPASIAQPATSAAPREKVQNPAVAARPSEPPTSRKESPPSPSTGRAPAPAPIQQPATGPVVANGTTKSPGKEGEGPEMPVGLPKEEPAEQTKPDPKPNVAENQAKPDDPAPEPGSPEAVLAKRGLMRKVEGKTLFFLVDTEQEFARGLPPVRVAGNRLEVAYKELDAAVEVELTVQYLGQAITTLQFAINGLNATMASYPTNTPLGRNARQECAQEIQARQAELAEAQRNIVLAQQQRVKPAKLQELKDEFTKRKDEFMAAAGALYPTYRKLQSQYKELGKDEEIKQLLKTLGERNKVRVKLGPSDSVQLTMSRVVRMQEQLTEDPEAFRRNRKNTRLKGRDAPKAKMPKGE
jgi:serine/threonine protein kinase